MEGDAVVEVDGPALEVVLRAGGREELLELEEVIELEVVMKQSWFETDAFS
jgi:hypothetical protein